MNKILAIFRVTDMSKEQYDNVMKDLDTAGFKSVKPRSSHTMGLNGSGGCVVVDVWDSENDLNEFFGTLGPILVKNGVNPPQPEIYPVHNQVL